MSRTAGSGRSASARAARFARFHALKGLDAWRANGRHRTVNMPPESGIGVGNMFSFWLWGHYGQATGRDWWVLQTDAMRPWLEVFPRIEPLLLARDELRFSDARECDWSQDFDKFPEQFLPDFVRERLLRSDLPVSRELSEDVVTVNVRRGDYYSDPQLRLLYGFDVRGYVRAAMHGARQQQAITRVDVVSDDPGWCAAELGFLAEFGEVTYQRGGDGAVENLAQLASARRLVLTNSTFSYWGAYLSNGVYGDNHALVWAPAFHRRGINGDKAFQLDPRWSVVEGYADLAEADHW